MRKVSKSIILFASYLFFIMMIFQSAKAKDFEIEKLSEMNEVVHSLLTSYRPSEILIIFDLDGTLTSKGTPDPTQMAKPRGISIQMIRDFKKLGIQLIVSSGWDNFQQTIKRIEDLGLVKEFKIDRSFHAQLKQKVFTDKIQNNITLNYYQNGNCISIQDPNVNTKYFKQKALAPYLTMPDELAAGEIKKVIFADDSKLSVDTFKTDADRFQLYTKMSVDYFILSDASNDKAH